jgi:hypothetical protein
VPSTSDMAAGWYPDPSGEPQQRYWNGEQWTKQTRPYPAPTAHATGIAAGADPQVNPAAAAAAPTTSTRPSSAGRTIILVGLAIVLSAVGIGAVVFSRQSADQAAREAAEQGAQIGGPPMSDVEALLCPDGPATDTGDSGVDCSRTGSGAGSVVKPSPTSLPQGDADSSNAELKRICSVLKADMARPAKSWYDNYSGSKHPEEAAIAAVASSDPSARYLPTALMDMQLLGKWVRTSADEYYVGLLQVNQASGLNFQESEREARGLVRSFLDFGIKDYIKYIQLADLGDIFAADAPPVSWDATWAKVQDACP